MAPLQRTSSSGRPTMAAAAAHRSGTSTGRQELQRQLRLLAAIRCLRAAHLAQPLLVPFYSHHLGLEPASILWLGSAYSALVTLAELPSGVASDRLARRTTLHVAFGALACGPALTALATRMPVGSSSLLLWACLGAAQVARAVGSSLYSGTDMAFLYEVIKKYEAAGTGSGGDRRDRKGGARDDRSNGSAHHDAGGDGTADSTSAMLLTMESRNVFYTTSTEACVAAAGGWLSWVVGVPTVVGLAAVPFVAGAILSLFLDGSKPSGADARVDVARNGARNDAVNAKTPSDPREATESTAPSGLRSLARTVRRCVPRRMRAPFFCGVVLNCGTYSAATALSPLLWDHVGIPFARFGALHATCGAAAALGALLAPALGRSRGAAAPLPRLLGLAALGYALAAAATLLARGTPPGAAAPHLPSPAVGCAVLASLVLSAVRGLAWPLLGAAINAAVEGDGSRATTLSLFSGAIKIGMCVKNNHAPHPRDSVIVSRSCLSFSLLLSLWRRVITGMLLGVLFKHSPTPSVATGVRSTDAIETGLLQGSALFGIIFFLTALCLIYSEAWRATPAPPASTLGKSRQSEVHLKSN